MATRTPWYAFTGKRMDGSTTKASVYLIDTDGRQLASTQVIIEFVATNKTWRDLWMAAMGGSTLPPTGTSALYYRIISGTGVYVARGGNSDNMIRTGCDPDPSTGLIFETFLLGEEVSWETSRFDEGPFVCRSREHSPERRIAAVVGSLRARHRPHSHLHG